MILLLIVTSVSCILLLIFLYMINVAESKQLEAEAQLVIHQQFFDNVIKESVLATDNLVEKIIDKVFERLYPEPQLVIKSYIKHLVIKEIGQLRHIDDNYYRLLGASNKDKQNG